MHKPRLVIMRIKYVLASRRDECPCICGIYPSERVEFFETDQFSRSLIPSTVLNEDWTVLTLYRTAHGFSHVHSKTATKYFVYNSVRTIRTESGKHDVYSLAVVTQEPFYVVFKSLLADASRIYAQEPTDELLAEVYHSIHSVNIKHMPLFTHCEKRILQMNVQTSLFSDYYASQGQAGQPADTHFYNAGTTFRNKQYLMRVPTDIEFHNAGEFSVLNLVKRLLKFKIHGTHPDATVYGKATPPIIALWLAMLTGKEILVLKGEAMPVSQLCELVLAISFLGSAAGLLDTHRWTYPYMSTVTELQAPFLAGVESLPEFWDAAVDLDRGCLIFNGNCEMDSSPPLSFDSAFVRDCQETLASTELQIREHVACYTTSVLRALGRDMLFERASQRQELPESLVPGYGYYWADKQEQAQFDETYSGVKGVWQQLPSFEHFLTTTALDTWPQVHKPVVDLQHHYDMLRHGDLSPETSAAIYQLLDNHINDVVDITQFLASTNSIYYLVLGLYHPFPEIRDKVAQLLLRLQKHSAGACYFMALPPFHSIGLQLALQERQLVANAF